MYLYSNLEDCGARVNVLLSNVLNDDIENAQKIGASVSAVEKVEVDFGSHVV
jgi:hypothetical protein